MVPRIEPPEPGEYAPYYARYISVVPEGDVLRILADQLDQTRALLAAIPEPRAEHRYAEGKWSIKEVIGHIVDSERIFSYRALRIARGDPTPLAGFEQDDYVARGNFNSRALADLAQELWHLRQANLLLFGSLDQEALLCAGQASGAAITVRSLVYIIAGHERHHVRVLRERYL